MADDRVRATFMDTVYRDADRDDLDYYLERAMAVDYSVFELAVDGKPREMSSAIIEPALGSLAS